jgi:hypothetical protein
MDLPSAWAPLVRNYSLLTVYTVHMMLTARLRIVRSVFQFGSHALHYAFDHPHIWFVAV